MPDDQKAIQFPLLPHFWDTPGDIPSFRLWTVQLENYTFSVDSQCMAVNKMLDEFKNRLLLSLLGSEGITSFACVPEVQMIATTSFADFFAAAKKHFQLTTSPICAYFHFQLHHQQAGESVAHFANALRMLLVDCEVATEAECKTLLARQLVFGCRGSPTLQKLLMLKEFNFESIYAEMESQEKANENVKVIHGGVEKGKGSEFSVCVVQQGQFTEEISKLK